MNFKFYHYLYTLSFRSFFESSLYLPILRDENGLFQLQIWMHKTTPALKYILKIRTTNYINRQVYFTDNVNIHNVKNKA